MLLTRSLEDVAALPELPLGGSQTQLRNALRIQSAGRDRAGYLPIEVGRTT